MRIHRSAQFFAGLVGVIGALFVSATVSARDFEITLTGAPADIADIIRNTSELSDTERQYPTSAALRRAASRDIAKFENVLQSAGFYKGAASFELTPGGDGAATIVNYIIDAGDRFTIAEYEILYADDASGRPSTIEETGVTPTRSAAGAALRDTQLLILNFLWESGFPNAEIVARRALINPDTTTANAIYEFRTGAKAHFGGVNIQGAERANEEYLKKLKTWEPDEEYERSKIVEYRDRLSKTAMFSDLDVAPGATGPDGAAPVVVRVSERKHRTIGAGASYSTAVGPGGRLFFENRNLFGQGESLRVEMRGSQVEQSIDFNFAKPLPVLPGTAFGSFEFLNETTEAFDARSLRLSGGLSKLWLDDRLETRGAIALETSKVETDTTEDRNYFVSAPLSVLWNSEDDLLDPAKGFRVNLVVTPYTGSETFQQAEFSARSRIFFGDDDRFTLAGRVGMGATFSASLAELPSNKRYFAGGGGSIRGFGFQEAGPLDADANPIGGRSYVEGAAEIRARVMKSLQVAAFIDAGNVGAASLPDFDEDLFIGVGGGIRYLTPIGPIRADVAFPLEKRESDSAFQVYISIGQPF
ncbi:MAG: BamA/TamA family outer membrane protein [Marinicaulis sp.]|nr:BamA/TamA family outer membrane protein [Marinicaulis sp.]